MAKFDRGAAAASFVLGAALLASGAAVAAQSQGRLDGAWTITMSTCSDVFTKTGDKISFKKGLGDSLPGFIIEGDRVRGAVASCRMSSKGDKGGTTTFVLDCTTDIMEGTTKMSVRMIDDNTLESFSPAFPEIKTTYSRCQF